MKLWFLSLLSVFLIFSCKKEAIIPEPEPPLKVLLCSSADTITIFNNETKSLYLWSADYWVGFKYTVVSQPDWISVTPSTGIIAKEKYEIKLTTNLNINNPYSREGKVFIYTDYGSKEIVINGIIKENVIFDLPDSMYINFFESEKLFKVKNRGNVHFNYSIQTSNNNISVIPTSGYLAVDNESEIKINVIKENLSNGKFYTDIYFDCNSVKDTIKVCIENNNNLMTYLMSELVDAEYSKTKDILAYITTSPQVLNIYHTTHQKTEKIILNDPPICVSISPDGERAVVGFDDYISVFDLNLHKLIKSYSISCKATDVVFTPDYLVYIFTNEQMYSPRSIDTKDLTAIEKIHSDFFIMGNRYARLHPSGKYIYCTSASNTLTLEKYDIQSDSIKIINKTPYWGEYNLVGNLWISENGKYIFTGAKDIFKSSDNQNEDMIYHASFNDESNSNYFLWMDQSTQNSEIYTIVDDFPDNILLYHLNKTKIFVYNSDSFMFKRFYELKKYHSTDYLGNSVNYEPNPRFVFCNQAGNQLFVFTKAFDSDINNAWALQEIKIEK